MSDGCSLVRAVKNPFTPLLIAIFGWLQPIAVARAENQPSPIVEAAHREGVTLRFAGNGRDLVNLSVANASDASRKLDIPAGLICKANGGAAFVLLRAAHIDVGSHAVSDAQIPAAALSSRDSPIANAVLDPQSDSDPRLVPLLTYLETKPDVPRATSQLIVLALLENIDFAHWLQFVSAPVGGAPAGAQRRPDPSEIVQAIDAIGVLRAIRPGKEFALATDPELKLLALRNPICRPKAMQLYGMIIPGDAPAGGVPPDLSQLLHTKPGDNCPICRMRAQMQAPASDL